MTQDNVLDICDNLNQLEIDYNNWMMLTDDQKRISNDICMQIHGCNNIDFYEKQKKILSYIQESAALMSIDSDKFALFKEKVDKSFLLMSNNQNIIIIPLGEDLYANSYINSKNMNIKSNIDILYQKFQMLPQDHKNMSNGYSLEIWGCSVEEAYARTKAFISQLNGESDIIKSDNLYESAMINIDNILSGKEERVEFENSMDFSDDIPQVVPYLTYTEYSQMFDVSNTLVSDYITIGDPKKYYNLIESLQNQLNETDSDKSVIENNILKLGWFPYKKINGESIKEARERQIKWYNENMSFNIIDLSKVDVITETEGIDGDKSRLEPLFLTFTSGDGFIQKVIKKWTKNHYCHAGISLSSKMDKIYSFSAKEMNKENKSGGFIIESLDSYSALNITDFLTLCFFVDKDVKKKIKDELSFYEKNKDATKYNKMNYFNIAFNIPYDSGSEKMQMVCSQFVDYILKLAGIDITNKSSNLVTPADLVNANPDKINIYVLFEGKIKNYKYKEIDKKISFLKDRLSYFELSATTSDNMRNNTNTTKVIETVLNTCSDNEEINNILRETRNSIIPNYFTIDTDNYSEIKKSALNNHKNLMECSYADTERITKLLNENRGIASYIESKLNDKSYSDIYSSLYDDFTMYSRMLNESANDFGYGKYYKTKVDNYNFIYDGKNIFT